MLVFRVFCSKGNWLLYGSSTIAFLTIFTLYDPSPLIDSKAWVKRLIVTVCLHGSDLLPLCVIAEGANAKRYFFLVDRNIETLGGDKHEETNENPSNWRDSHCHVSRSKFCRLIS